MKKESMESLFNETTHSEIIERISQLSPQSQGKWGKMTVAQMFSHCQYPLLLALGRQSIKRPNFLTRLFFKTFKASMYNDKLWKPNLPTVKEYRVETQKDFEEEQEKLLQLVHDFHAEKNRSSWQAHPSFGHFTHDQWGKMQYKHLDHHLRQFGV